MIILRTIILLCIKSIKVYRYFDKLQTLLLVHIGLDLVVLSKSDNCKVFWGPPSSKER